MRDIQVSEGLTTGPKTAFGAAVRLYARAYQFELALFGIAFFLLASFSSFRFFRQSAAPHFVYQAQAWIEGRADIDVAVLPNMEDWACVRDSVNGTPTRCTAPLRPTDRWYSSFPAFPSMAMLPFVALNGYQFNDTSFGVIVGALAIALFYGLLRSLAEREGLNRSATENAGLALLLGFGTLFFYAAIRGEVWFSAEVMGVALTAIYLQNAAGARRPLLAGIFWSMAVLTRTPLVFTIVFFLCEAVCPTQGQRAAELQRFVIGRAPAALRKLGLFMLGAVPLGLSACFYNFKRFGSITEFGHRFFFNNRVNTDIDTYGLFHWTYLARNLDAAFLKLPVVDRSNHLLSYDPWGLSLFITLPMLALAFVPAIRPRHAYFAAAAMATSIFFSYLMPGNSTSPVGDRPIGLWVVLTAVLVGFVALASMWVREKGAPRLLVPTLWGLVACVLPGLFYQNTGYAQFGFRFSLDYTPYVVVLVALSGWRFRQLLPASIAVVSVAVNFWGAVAFRGYTELVRSLR